MFGRWRNVAAVTAVGASAYAIDRYYYAGLVERSARASYVLSWVAYQYSRNTAAYDSLDDLHELAAEKLFDMVAKNKGLYIKQGQAIANQGMAFPMAYQRRFLKMYDDAPADSWALVDATLRAHLGRNYADLFEYIDHEPVASASIAQVHKAKLKKEQVEVAVKVQHPYIAKQMPVDLWVYRTFSWVYAKVFDLPMARFTRYISDQISTEADFRIEAKNTALLKLHLAADRAVRGLGVYVPNNYLEYSSSRVLVTEWIDGVLLADKQRLVDGGFNLATMMRQYVASLGRQIFEYGFVHSDPHPGNMLARFRNGKQELVILDHGLYISLPDKFKGEYRRIWKSLFNFDKGEIDKVCSDWGVGNPDLMSTMIQLRPPDGKALPKEGNPIDMMRTFFGDGTKFPLQILFLLRTMRMMQTLNQAMGSPVNRINMLTESAIQLLPVRRFSWREWALFAVVRVSLLVSDFVFWLFRLRQIVRGDRYGGKGEGMEDYIERYMKETMRRMGYEVAKGM